MECLTLKMNPHFYAELPTLSGPEPYGEFFGDGVKIDPTEDFRHSNKFYVLTDRPDFVYIMTDQDLRPFGNFWCAKNAIIFKGLGNPVRFPPPVANVLPDISGRLMGWSIVKASLRGTYCGFCERLPVSTVPRASRNSELRPIFTQVHPSIWDRLISCNSMQGFGDFGLCVYTRPSRRVAPDSSPVRCAAQVIIY